MCCMPICITAFVSPDTEPVSADLHRAAAHSSSHTAPVHCPPSDSAAAGATNRACLAAAMSAVIQAGYWTPCSAVAGMQHASYALRHLTMAGSSHALLTSRCKLPGHQHVSAHHPMYAQKQPDCQQQLRGTTRQHKPQPVHHRVHIAAPHLSQQQPLAANSKPHMLSFVMLSIQSLAARQPTCARSSQAFSSSPGALPAIMYRSV